MKLLLDTHVFIWWDSNPDDLSATARDLLSNPLNSLVLSVASIWEMQIKIQLGKLHLNLPLVDIISHQQTRNGLIVLPVTQADVYALTNVPLIHKDPFDRLLIAQALNEGATLVSADSEMAKYPLKVVW